MLVSKFIFWDYLYHRMGCFAQRPMLAVFLSSMSGVGLAVALPASLPWSWLTIFGIVVWLGLALSARDRLLVWAILLSLAPLAAWRYQVQERWIASDRLHSLATETWSPVVIEGCVESTSRWRPDLLQLGDHPQKADLSSDEVWETLLEVQVKAIRDGRTWKRAEYGRMQIAVKGRRRDLLPGDRVEGMIDWQRISPPTNPGQFDLASKYRRSAIFVRGRTDVSSQVKKLGVATRWRLDRCLSRIVIAADIAFHRYVPFQQATLASALVLGQREQVEWAMQESLLATGTIHMLAISGMHIEMVGLSVVMLCLLLRVPRRAMLMTTMVVVVAYALLCGGNPPVARAAVLVVALGIARWIGKTTNSLNLLGLAGVAVLFYRPSNWLEIGTQLSFLAVAILILLKGDASKESKRRDYLDELLVTHEPAWRKGWLYFRTAADELLQTSFVVWILTAPLVLFRFNILSPVAVILNLLLWIPMLLALLSGLGLLVVGPLIPFLAYPLGWICGANLWITQWIVQTSEKIPLSHFWLPAPSGWWTAFFYISTFAIIGLFGFSKSVRRSILLLASGWIAIGVMPAIDRQYGRWLPAHRAQPADQLSIIFIDVGHGTCVLIQTPSGQAWLYDAGRLGDAQRSYLGIAGVLWERRISKLDGLILSHADSDHFNAIAGLSRRFAIGRLITTQRTLDNPSRALQETLAGLRALRVTFELRQAGDSMDDPDIRWQVLHPPAEGVLGSDNANSLCLMLEYAGHRILLPGDLEGEGIDRLLSYPRHPVTVLMAPHHGSLAESPLPLLEWCQPKFTIVSGGSRAREPRVRAAYSQPGREVLITAVEHAVRCTIERSGELHVAHWQHPNWVQWPLNQGL